MSYINNNGYILSNKITVFPCANRGQGIDIESKLNCESSIINEVNGFGRNINNIKDSYIISKSDGGKKYIVCIHGYRFYFELENATDVSSLHYLAIKIGKAPELETISTNALQSWYGQNSCLDTNIDGQTYFTGLKFQSTVPTDTTTYLDIAAETNKFIIGSNAIESNISGESITGNLVYGFVPYSIVQIHNVNAKNTAYNTGAVVLGQNTKSSTDYELVVGKYNAPATNSLFTVGCGTADNNRKNALEVYKDDFVVNTKVRPKADLSYDLGSTTARFKDIYGRTSYLYGNSGIIYTNNSSNKFLLTNSYLWNYVPTTIYNTFTVGATTSDLASNFYGSITTTGNVILNSSDKVLFIGGTDTSYKAKILTSDGSITTKGAINAANDLGITIRNSADAADITKINANFFSYSGTGTSPTATFGTTNKNCNTTINGTLTATGATILSSTLGVTGAATLSSTLTVTGAATLSSTLTVTGATTLSSTLGVSGKTTITNNSGTIFECLSTASSSKFKIDQSSTTLYTDCIISGASSTNTALKVKNASTAPFEVLYDGLVKSTNGVKVIHASATGNAYELVTGTDGGTSMFSVSYGGDVTAQTYNAKSDKRLKENIVDYTLEKSILDLQVKKFDFIDGKKNNIGCIAQELQEICPEIVHENEDGYLSIEENKLVYLLLDEVKKLRKEVNELKK